MESAKSTAQANAGLSPAKRAILLRRLQQRHASTAVDDAIVPRAERTTAPLSYVQAQMWFLDQLNPGDIMYNRPSARRISGALDRKLLQLSLQEIISRHEILRTTFSSSDGIAFQLIHPPSGLLISPINLSTEPEHARDQRARDVMLSEAQRAFDLASGPLLRALLLQLAADQYILLLCTHHIVFDGWSERILWQELAAHYEALAAGAKPVMPELAIQYGDYAHWQRQQLRGPLKEVSLLYWRRQLEGLGVLDLPTDRPRPAVLTHAGAREHVTLPGELGAGLRQLSRQCEATLYMTLLAAFQALLGRYSGQQDIAVGTPVAGRQRLELEPLIGVFINTLVLRARISPGQSFRELLAQVRTTTLDAFAHQEMPFELLIEELRPVRDSSRSPLIQALFQVRNLPDAPVEIAGLHMEKVPLDLHTSKLDLALDVTELAAGLDCQFEYNTDLFDAATIHALADDYEKLLRNLVAQPDLPLDQLGSWRQIARPSAPVHAISWSACVAARASVGASPARGEPQTTVRHASFPLAFEAQVLSSPDHPAVVGEDGGLSYTQLNHRANTLAKRLQAHGVGPDVPVALCVERSVAMISAMLGILKSGGAYVPLDPAYPTARLQWMLAHSGARAVVTQRRFLAQVPADPGQVVLLDYEPDPVDENELVNPPTTVTANDLAYIMYTSGSTGLPKGVMVPHGALMHYVDAAQRLYGLTAADRVLQFASISFDGSVEEIFCALATGATLFLRTDSTLGSMRALLDKCAAWRITFLSLTTAYWHQLAAAIAAEGLHLPKALRLLVVGGEKINGTLVRTWFDHVHHPVRLLNTYGPTESTVVATAYEITPRDAADPAPEIPIGRPLGCTRVYILDNGGEPVPVGDAGELCIGGAGVARGYLNHNELTAERFVADRFSTEPGARLYRTGDLVRTRSDGEIEFLGRLDDQVKVRGFRIEPGEVEAALLSHSGVRAAAVTAREDRLVAYVVPHKRGTLEGGELRRDIGAALPDYMVPSVYVELESLPLTPSGKLDRKALLELEGTRLETRSKSEGPRTKLEEDLTEIWRKVLGLERVGVHDNFFELGGHSLLATQVMSRVRATFGVEVPLRALFENPTVEGLAAAVGAALGAGVAPHAAAKAANGHEDGASTFAGSLTPASFAQQRLWFLDQLDPGQTVYVIDHAIRIIGPLDAAILERALNEIIRRHATLRTTIGVRDGEPVQVTAEALTLTLPVMDISHKPQAEREVLARVVAEEIAGQPFDLARGPLLRLRLIRLGAQDHVLAIPIHHIIADRLSLGILEGELAALYEAFHKGEPSPLPDLPIQYAEFAVWQREQLHGASLKRQLDYWKQQLKNLKPLDLPTDRPRSDELSARGALCEAELSSPLSLAIRELSVHQGVTPFMTLLAAFQLLLHRHCGQDDLAVGTPVAGRVHPDVDSLMGFFVNNLVLRTNLSGNPSFCELLARVKETVLGAFAHQDIPFERLVEELKPPRDTSRNPLFDVAISFMSGTRSVLTRGDLRYEPFDKEQITSKFALTLRVADEDDGRLRIGMVYQTDLFDTQRIQCLLEQLGILLQQIVDAPECPIDTYALVSPTTQSLLPDPTVPLAEPPQETVTSMFLKWVERAPAQTALRQGNRQWTYGELAASAQLLASHLAGTGLCKGDVVAISGERSFGLVATILAVLMAGGVMLTIDRTLPRARRRFMLKTAQARLMLVSGAAHGEDHQEYQRFGLATHCVDPASGEPLNWEVPDGSRVLQEPVPDDPAYVFFTSGSTGMPKGVRGCHKGISHFVNWQRRTFAITSQDQVSQLTSLSFDVVLRDLFLPLTSGATLCLPEEPDLLNVPEWLERAGITVLHTVPTLVQQWLSQESAKRTMSALRWVFIAGEPLMGALVRQWRKTFPSAAQVVNLYGPTETTLAKCYYVVPEHHAPGVQPVGMPLPQTQVLIVGPGDRLCGVGEAGEIVVRTPYRGVGYLNPDAQARPSFAPNPFRDNPHDIVYYTGDRGRYRPDGLLEILGRLDDQVKIRGVRIEPAEVNAVLSRHPCVRACAVVPRSDQKTLDRFFLAAYVVPVTPNAVDPETLRIYLGERLPAAMVPTAFGFLDGLPTTNSGKVDRKALPSLDPHTSGAVESTCSGPRTALERALTKILCELFKRREIGIHDDFFALGGYSLLLLQLVTRLRKEWQIDLDMRSVFEARTIARLAALIEPLQPVLEEAPPKGIPRIRRGGDCSRPAPEAGTDRTKESETADEDRQLE
jgi:amino acid adenylation domain-containing protein